MLKKKEEEEKEEEEKGKEEKEEEGKEENVDEEEEKEHSHNYPLVEERAIQSERLILPSLPTHTDSISLLL